MLAALVAEASIDPESPVLILAILKHPLVRLGCGLEDLEVARRTLERSALRGARGAFPGWIEARLQAAARPRDGEPPPSPEQLQALADAGALLAALRASLAFAAAPYTGATATPAEAARGPAQSPPRSPPPWFRA